MSRELGLSGIVTGGRQAGGRRDRPQPMSKEMAGILGDVPLFAGLSRRHLNRVAGLATTRWYHPGSEIVKAGGPGDAFFVILNGRASVRVRGRRIALQTGDFFGEMSLIDGEPRSATVITQSEVLAMVVPRSKFVKLLQSEPKVAQTILATMSRRVRALQAAASV
jgi:CRP/FNR family transcriptional regulator/CRP/FNR family cyclic AMP-dependent transcriptional regulator